ncbi:unnamed protein product, partial [Ectocarpus sp. 12 AP-2014]
PVHHGRVATAPVSRRHESSIPHHHPVHPTAPVVVRLLVLRVVRPVLLLLLLLLLLLSRILAAHPLRRPLGARGRAVAGARRVARPAAQRAGRHHSGRVTPARSVDGRGGLGLAGGRSGESAAVNPTARAPAKAAAAHASRRQHASASSPAAAASLT